MGTTYYRIVRHAIPTADDFGTAREEGRPFVSGTYRLVEHIEGEWAEGISVYDDLEYALRRARTNRTSLGRYVATLVVPIDQGIEIRQTSRDRRHYTIYTSGQRALELVQGATVSSMNEGQEHE